MSDEIDALEQVYGADADSLLEFAEGWARLSNHARESVRIAIRSAADDWTECDGATWAGVAEAERVVGGLNSQIDDALQGACGWLRATGAART